MKEFMMIFVGTDYEDGSLSPSEIEQQMGKWFAWVDKLKADDVYVEGRPLTTAAKRVTNASLVVSDGPFVETKELVGGYFIVKANSYDEVIKMCADFPDYDYGGFVEVREIATY